MEIDQQNNNGSC